MSKKKLRKRLMSLLARQSVRLNHLKMKRQFSKEKQKNQNKDLIGYLNVDIVFYIHFLFSFNYIILQAESDKKSLNERIQRQEIDWRKERDQLIGRATDLEVEIKVPVSKKSSYNVKCISKTKFKYFQSERKKKDRIEKEREQEMKDKDDEIMNLKERIKRTEIELKVAQERFEDLKNQDTRSRGFSLFIIVEH